MTLRLAILLVLSALSQARIQAIQSVTLEWNQVTNSGGCGCSNATDSEITEPMTIKQICLIPVRIMQALIITVCLPVANEGIHEPALCSEQQEKDVIRGAWKEVISPSD